MVVAGKEPLTCELWQRKGEEGLKRVGGVKLRLGSSEQKPFLMRNAGEKVLLELNGRKKSWGFVA